jgi:hypothetical protein
MPLTPPPSSRKPKPETALAQAVRNSLNLPKLKVDVRRIATRRAWGIRLHKDSLCSNWIELNDADARIMRQLAILPAIRLGTFRVAYQELRELTEPKRQGQK